MHVLCSHKYIFSYFSNTPLCIKTGNVLLLIPFLLLNVFIHMKIFIVNVYVSVKAIYIPSILVLTGQSQIYIGDANEY